MPRLEPLDPPYSPEIAERLEAMMPGDLDPLLLFRTFVHNLPMASAMGPWGGYELSRRSSLSMRDREIVIDRCCARCGCEYEWGVHVAFFAKRVELSEDQVRSLTHGSAMDPCWEEHRDRLLIEAVDSLHDHARIHESLWVELDREFTAPELLDLTMLTGWYHAISFTANTFEIDREAGAPTFDDVKGP